MKAGKVSVTSMTAESTFQTEKSKHSFDLKLQPEECPAMHGENIKTSVLESWHPIATGNVKNPNS